MLNVKKMLTKLLQSNYYGKGDTITNAFYWDGFGFITGSATQLVIYLPVHKSLEFVSGLTITRMLIAFRHVGGGYVGGSWYDVVADSTVTITSDLSNNVIMFQLVKTGGWGVTNNTPVVGRVRFTGTFS